MLLKNKGKYLNKKNADFISKSLNTIYEANATNRLLPSSAPMITSKSPSPLRSPKSTTGPLVRGFILTVSPLP